MAATTLATAWCSFEFPKWGGQSTKLAAAANDLQRRVAFLELQGAQATTIAINMFTQLLEARQNGHDDLVQFYAARFPPEAKKAYEAWMAQKPFENSAADPHPFVPKLYQMRGTKEMAEAAAVASHSLSESERIGGIAAQYTATTVLLAAVLFFVGTSTKFESARLRKFVFTFGVMAFLLAALRIVTLPIAY